MNFQVTLAARYLWGRKLRTFLTTLAVVFGTLVIFSTGTILPTMIKAFQANAMAVSGQVDATITQIAGEAFPSKEIDKVKTIAGIRAIAGTLSRTINIPEKYYSRSEISALTLTGIDPRAAQMMHNYSIKGGRFLGNSDTHVAVITTSLAENLGLGLNDRLYLPTTEGSFGLKVVGLLPARTLPGNEEVLVTLLEGQKLMGLPERINTIEINLDTTDLTQREVILKELESRLGDNYSLGALSSGTEMLASIQTGQIAFNMIGFLALFMGGFIIFNTFRTIVAERRHDIGMLRAIGASRPMIIGLILTEGVFQGIVGTLVGIGLGYFLSVGAMILLGDLLAQYTNLQMGAPVVTLQLIVTTGVLGVGATLFAGLLPAFSASRVTPLEALRPSLAEVIQRTVGAGVVIGIIMIVLAVLGLVSGILSLIALGCLMFMIGLVLVAPALVRPIASIFSGLIGLIFARQGTGTLAQNNLSRQPSRAAITASTTMIGLAIIVGLGGMIWSISGGFLGMLQRSLGSDYLIMPPSVALWGSNVGAKQTLGDKLRAIPGVKVVSSMRFEAASVKDKSVALLGIDPEAYKQVASLTFQAGDAKTAYTELAEGRSLIANGVFAAQAELKVGDIIQLSTPTGWKEYRIIAIAGDYLNAKVLTAYISQTNILTDFHNNEDIFFQLNLEPDAKTAQVETRIKKALKDYPQFKLISGKSYFDENKQVFNSIFVFYFVLLGILAAPSLIALLNTLAIGVIERTREIGMLRAIGATQKQVRRMVVAESLLLAMIGTAFGLLAGLYLGYIMVLGLSAGGYPVSYTFPYAGLLGAIATGLIFGVLAAILPARQAARLEIVHALRYE